MNTKVLYVITGLLALAAVGEGIYIADVKHKNNQAGQVYSSVPSWVSEKQNRLVSEAKQNQNNLDDKFFDNVFDDNFFASGSDPFNELYKMRDETGKILNSAAKETFNSSWNNWFDGRFNMKDFKTDIKTEGNNVVLTISVPGLDGANASVDINKDRIKASFSAAKTENKKDKHSYSDSIIKENYVKIMPVPYGADASSVSSKVEGDKIIVTFKKK
jgi:Molecular chaperone (small heat shock protein)